ncbi:MAG: mechanosensitive ion channel family protein [Lachnospiraceae bacterium]|nr:mechanosensitive ion channel family protein [Lachnospiraceae bacterium]
MDIKQILNQSLSTLSDGVMNLSGRILFVVVTLFVGYWLIKWVKKLIKKALNKFDVEEGTAGFLASIITVMLYIILGFIVAGTFGVDAASIVAILGSAGVAIGLAIQGSLSNFAGGILIILLKPFKVGDFIIEDNKGNSGTVTEISLFYTKLQTIDERTVVLPNGTLANTSLTNVTKTPNRMLELKFGVAYEADWKGAMGIVAEAFKTEEACIDAGEVEVYLDELADSAVVIGGRCYVKNDAYRFAKQRILEKVLTRFNEEGIEIPYQKMVVIHLKKKTNK